METTTAADSTDFDMFRLAFNDTSQNLLRQQLQLLNHFNRCMFSMTQENVEFCRDFFDSYFEGQNMQYKIPMLVAFCLLFLVGVTGNALVILSIVIFPTMRSRTNIFLLNLAISDLLIFFMCLPITAYNLISTRWVFGVAICKLSPFLQGVSVSVSIGSLASMSIKRYVVIRYPMTAKERMSNRAMGLWMAAIWVVSVLLCSPIPAAYKLSRHDFYWKSSVDFCVEDWQDSAARKTAYTMFLFAALYLVPLIAIFVDLRGSATEQPTGGGGGGGRGNLTAAEGNGTRAAAAQSGGQEVNVVMTTVLPICLLLGYANSAINPLCLVLISSKFKKYFKLILSCNCHADSQSQREQAQLYSMYSRAHPSAARHDHDQHQHQRLHQRQHQHNDQHHHQRQDSDPQYEQQQQQQTMTKIIICTI